ncbi:MAG: response regulator [Thermostichus sp. DG02_5_bins_236]
MVTQTLLIVEDDPDLLRVLALLLQRDNLQIETAQSIISAISSCQQQLADLIILDLGLPPSNGFQLVAWLNGLKSPTLPILVVYTARDLSEQELQQLQPITRHIYTKSRISPSDFRQQVFTLLDERVESKQS